jgi:hypothetical protein
VPLSLSLPWGSEEINDFLKVTYKIRLNPDTTWGGRAPSSLPKPRFPRTLEDIRSRCFKASHGSSADRTNPSYPNTSCLSQSQLVHARGTALGPALPKRARHHCPAPGLTAHSPSSVPPAQTPRRCTAVAHPSLWPIERSPRAVARALPRNAADPSWQTAAGSWALQSPASHVAPLGSAHPRVSPYLERIIAQWGTCRAQGAGPRRNHRPNLQKEDGAVKEKDRRLPSLPAL